jgi:RsiW-degrading membrane proteinase PrsW (M82 family)
VRWCIATGLSFPINAAFLHFADAWVWEHPQLRQVLGPDAALLLAAPISAPIAEEISKALGVVLIFWLLRAEFDNMRDGIVYGGLVGLGFNWFEAALYVAQGHAEFGTPPYGFQLGIRYALFGFGGHALFTGLFFPSSASLPASSSLISRRVVGRSAVISARVPTVTSFRSMPQSIAAIPAVPHST